MKPILRIAVVSLSCTVALAAPVKQLPVADVRLLDSPFRDAQQRTLDYLLSLDPDRLLSGMRDAARLKPKAPLYGGWERRGSGIVGHYLSACAWMHAATGDPRVKAKMDYIVAEMAAYQDHRGEGGLYASRWEADRWYADLGRGKLHLSNVVPWYVAHKTLAGLRDAWLTGGNAQAKDVLVRYADWCVAITSKLTDEQWADLTSKEFGAPNEVFADLFAETKKPAYLELARRFRKEPMVAALAAGHGSALRGRHANTEIPLFVGYQRIHEVTGEARWGDAAKHFWETVLSSQTFTLGGNSIWEAFIDPAEHDRKLLEPCGPETCNSYNMLKLTRQLHEADPQARHADFAERVIYNHILPSLGPAPDGGFAYYTPLRPGHYKRYSLPFDAFWCCVGSGMENHGRYGNDLYAASADRFLVDLFIPSVARWKARSVEFRLTTDFPEDGIVTLAMKIAKPEEFTLSVRCPGWVDAAKVRFRINGEDQPVSAKSGSYLDVKRTWKTGDVVQTFFPPGPRMELSAGGGFASFFHGPVLLAAGLGTEGLEKDDFYADGSRDFIQLGRKEMDPARVPAITKEGNAGLLSQDKDTPASYTLDAVGGKVPLVPFYRIGLERYSIYFPRR